MALVDGRRAECAARDSWIDPSVTSDYLRKPVTRDC